MTAESQDEAIVALTSLIDQAQQADTDVMARIKALIVARNYLEVLTRRLVTEAREAGTSWDDLGQLFGTSAVNAKARYGDYHDYD